MRHYLIISGLTSLIFVIACGLTVYAQPGTIAYVKDATEIRLIDGNGSNDRLVWANPVSTTTTWRVAWRPDGQELAFSSEHESACSIYQYDIYGIRPDGSGLRRITNAPDCATLSSFPKGSVSVEVENQISSTNFFLIYVEGASTAHTFTLDPGFRTTLTIPNVADLGENYLQSVVIIDEPNRWIDPAVTVDVKAGITVTAASRFDITAFPHTYSIPDLSWQKDGLKIGFVLGDGVLSAVPVNPSFGNPGELLFDGNTFGYCLDWSRNSDNVIFGDQLQSGIFMAPAGTSGNEVRIVETDRYIGDLAWLPDGSGFIFSLLTDFFDAADLYLYQFANASITQLTTFSGEFAIFPAVSPHGARIAFVRTLDAGNGPFSIWTIDINGGNLNQLVDNGSSPSWGVETPSSLETEGMVIPEEIELYQNYPNPFNPSTTIRYDLQKSYTVKIKIYDSLGRELRTLVNDHQPPGEYTVTWDGRDATGQAVSSGIYNYRLQAGKFVESRTMQLVR